MEPILLWFKDVFEYIEWYRDFPDIIIVTIVIYQLLKLTSQTRASQVLKGFGMIIVVALISTWLRLTAVSWLFNYILNAGAIALVIIFQPELRRALEKIGRGRILNRNAFAPIESGVTETVNELVRAVQRMSGHHVGALIVIQNVESLGDIIESGTTIYARVSSPLIENIFTPNTPLHDGAIIIKDNVLLAAGCFLPMTANPYLAQEVGTRHRAALGLSENTDAFVIVVSEETGVVSVAQSGKLTRYIDGNSLRAMLEDIYQKDQKNKGINISNLIPWRHKNDRDS